MSNLEGERGRTLKAPLIWVDFVVKNPDILASLNRSPLRAEKLEDGKFLLKIFGVRVRLEEVHHTIADQEGTLKWFADVRAPWGIGKTHTLTTYKYYRVNENTTSIELTLSVELTTLSMRLYAFYFQHRIDRYLDKLCRHVEHAAQALSQSKESTAGTVNDDQKQRVEACRRRSSQANSKRHTNLPQMEGIIRVLMSEDDVFVSAEARMPDQTILTANGKFDLQPQERASLLSGMVSLAGINNRALATRGGGDGPTTDIDFRQTALEYGYKFFKQVCGSQLAHVIPVITSHGQGAVLRISVEGEAEQLPWEAMHDGQDFLCIRTCLTRSVTNLRPRSILKPDWEQTGILIVGANSRGDLPGVEQEVNGIGKILSGAGVSRFDVLTGHEASRNGVLDALESGEFGILHFSGHSVFDTNHPYQSYVELCGGTKIYLHELGHFSHAAGQNTSLGLVFLNSCQSARVGLDSLTGKQLSMCKALREAGVGHVIGMLWNVEDDAAVQVGASFYQRLLTSPDRGPESAMRETRLEVAMDRAWADGAWLAPVLYS